MIYVDTSVALAHLLAEDRAPPEALWAEPLVTSRLLEYELWTRFHALDRAATAGDAARAMLARVDVCGLPPGGLGRARRPFPVPVRTLDAMHLATVAFLRERGHDVELATYDERMASVADAMGIGRYGLDG